MRPLPDRKRAADPPYYFNFILGNIAAHRPPPSLRPPDQGIAGKLVWSVGVGRWQTMNAIGVVSGEGGVR